VIAPKTFGANSPDQEYMGCSWNTAIFQAGEWLVCTALPKCFCRRHSAAPDDIAIAISHPRCMLSKGKDCISSAHSSCYWKCRSSLLLPLSHSTHQHAQPIHGGYAHRARRAPSFLKIPVAEASSLSPPSSSACT